MGHHSTPAGLLMAAVLASVLGAEAQQRPSFRSGVDVVSLSVTVTGEHNRYITDLTEEDFLVFEDGVQQETTFFTRTQLPISLALLLDTSASMEERLQTAQEAAVGFTSRLRPEDMAEIINFDSRVEILETFTNDQQRLERAIRQTSAGGSTSLYNAIYISLKELKKVRAQTFEDVRRQAIVVLSDGEDTSSLVGFDEVLEQAKRSETAIYSIGLRSRDGRSRAGFRKPISSCGSCPERPGVWHSSRRGLEISSPSTSRLPRSSRTSTRWATPRTTHGGTACGGGSSFVSLARGSRRAPNRDTTHRASIEGGEGDPPHPSDSPHFAL